MMRFLNAQPKWVLALFFGGIALIAWAHFTGVWQDNPNIQMLSVGLTLMGLVAMMGEMPPDGVTIEEVETASYGYVRRKQVQGNAPTGSIRLPMEARKVISDGKPVYWEQGVVIENEREGNPTFPIRVELYKDNKGRVTVSGATQSEKWSAKERPDVVIIEPPDMVTFMRLKRIEEEKKLKGVTDG